MTTTRDAAQRYAPGQFSLAGMLSVFLACGIYFGLLTVTVGAPEAWANIERDLPWRPVWTILLSWGGLLALYRVWNLSPALSIHYSGPLACSAVALAALAINLFARSVTESLQISLYFLLYGFFVSVFFGFPVVVVMLIYRCLKRD